MKESYQNLKHKLWYTTLLNKIDIQELCDATEDAIIADGGSHGLSPQLEKIRRLLEGSCSYTGKNINNW